MRTFYISLSICKTDSRLRHPHVLQLDERTEFNSNGISLELRNKFGMMKLVFHGLCRFSTTISEWLVLRARDEEKEITKKMELLHKLIFYWSLGELKQTPFHRRARGRDIYDKSIFLIVPRWWWQCLWWVYRELLRVGGGGWKRMSNIIFPDGDTEARKSKMLLLIA